MKPTAKSALANYSRTEQRFISKKLAKMRKAEDWGEWKEISAPASYNPFVKGGRNYLTHKCYQNNIFTVQVGAANYNITHIGVILPDGSRPTFYEMQRIKNEFAGEECQAVEIYPEQSKLIDRSDMWHIWVLPVPLPVGLK